MSATKAVLALCFIFYFVNQASSLKCYKCTSPSNGDCWKNPAQSKYVETCPGSRSIHTDSTTSNLKGSLSSSFLENISALIGSESLTASTSTYADSDCLKLTGSFGQIDGVIRMCISKRITDDQLKAVASAQGMTRITIKRCDSNLCNSS